MAEPQSVTNLGTAPEVERRNRMIRYSIAMSIRMVCIVLAILVQGWLMWVCFALAIVLPYWAVVIANRPMAKMQFMRVLRMVDMVE